MQGEVTAFFADFDLDTAGFRFQPLHEEIVVIGLKDGSYDTIGVKPGLGYGHPVKEVVSELINYSEIDYDTNADLLYKLATQAVTAVESGLPDHGLLKKTVFQFRRLIAARIYEQMMRHFQTEEQDYGKPVIRPFTRIEAWNFTALKHAGYKDCRDESFPAKDVRNYVFMGFEKSGHPQYKFDSRTEQTFAFVLEHDKRVLKWLRPAENQLRLWWHHNTRLYQPDFIVETDDAIYMVETKAANETESIDVREKAKAALKYCRYASEFTAENGGRPWAYALVPHDVVHRGNSFEGMVAPNVLRAS